MNHAVPQVSGGGVSLPETWDVGALMLAVACKKQEAAAPEAAPAATEQVSGTAVETAAPAAAPAATTTEAPKSGK